MSVVSYRFSSINNPSLIKNTFINFKTNNHYGCLPAIPQKIRS